MACSCTGSAPDKNRFGLSAQCRHALVHGVMPQAVLVRPYGFDFFMLDLYDASVTLRMSKHGLTLFEMVASKRLLLPA